MRRPVIILLVAAAAGLALLGALMVFSSSAALAYVKYDGDSMYFIKRHLVNLAVALFVAAFFALADYHIWEKLAWPVTLATLVLLGVALVAGVGNSAAPVKRWLRVGGFFFQPSELAKLATVFLLARFIPYRHAITNVYERWLPLAAVGAMFVGILVEPDFSMAFLLAATAFVLFFIGGVRLRYLLGAGVVLTPLLAVILVAKQYRVSRLLSYMDPWEYARGRGYQVIQSLIALGSGGLLGRGLGASNQKLFYLPQPHTDFVFAIVGEELGFVGAAAVVVAFAVLIVAGFRIAARAGDDFGRYLAAGLTTMVGLSALINLAVVTGLIPTTGIPLPFVSYGGTSLVVSAAAVGGLISVARRAGVETGFGYARPQARTVDLNGTFVDYA